MATQLWIDHPSAIAAPLVQLTVLRPEDAGMRLVEHWHGPCHVASRSVPPRLSSERRRISLEQRSCRVLLMRNPAVDQSARAARVTESERCRCYLPVPRAAHCRACSTARSVHRGHVPARLPAACCLAHPHPQPARPHAVHSKPSRPAVLSHGCARRLPITRDGVWARPSPALLAL